jgi:transcriptional regulator with XRE-family HTH domain
MLSSNPAEPSIGELVRNLRERHGWTQERLAREAGITITCLSNLERGATREPNIETVAGLASAFGLEPGELDARRLAELVARSASTFARRQAITRLLSLGEREVEAVVQFLQERAERKPRTK